LVDKIVGRGAKATENTTDFLHRGAKWRKSYSEMVFYIRVRMALAVTGESQQLADQ
jgi:hypothetical protein